ncbi:hypothetical protein GUG28_08600 [Xanthomonas citri pv. citri]|nr:hypothetical protein [Xanthomonas citri pv. citri]
MEKANLILLPRIATAAFEGSLTRKRERIETLLLPHALAMFASWLAGMAAEAIDAQHNLNPYRTSRRLYCLMRLGQEASCRGWLEHLSTHAGRTTPLLAGSQSEPAIFSLKSVQTSDPAPFYWKIYSFSENLEWSNSLTR